MNNVPETALITEYADRLYKRDCAMKSPIVVHEKNKRASFRLEYKMLLSDYQKNTIYRFP